MTSSRRQIASVFSALIVVASVIIGGVAVGSQGARAANLSVNWSTTPPGQISNSFSVSADGYAEKSSTLCMQKKRENDFTWSRVSGTCRSVSGGYFESYQLSPDNLGVSPGNEVTLRLRVKHSHGIFGDHVQTTGGQTTIYNQAPSSSRVSPYSETIQVQAGETVTFEASASDPDDNLAGMNWYVNGGQVSEFDTVSGGYDTATFQKTFNSEGTYGIGANVYDEERAYNDQAAGWTVDVCTPGLEVSPSQEYLGEFAVDGSYPTVTIEIENTNNCGELDWEVTSRTVFDVVDRGEDYIEVRPGDSVVGSFDNYVEIGIFNNVVEDDGFERVDISGVAREEASSPSISGISPSGGTYSIGSGVRLYGEADAGTDGIPEDQYPAGDPGDLEFIWAVDGEQVAKSSPDSVSGNRATDDIKYDFTETGDHEISLTVRDPVTGKQDSFSQDGFTVESPDGKIVSYVSPTSGEYQLNKWYDVTLEIHNSKNIPHTFQVVAQNPSGVETKDEVKTITLSPDETGRVTFQQRWYGVYTETRSFSHELRINSQNDRKIKTVDEDSVTLDSPPHGTLKIAPLTSDGKPRDIEIRLWDSDTGDLVLKDTIPDATLDINAKIHELPAGEYRLKASAAGFKSRTQTIDISSNKQTIVEPRLPPTGVDATIVDESFVVEDGPYEAGETVLSSVKIRNTGSEPYEFFVGFSVRSDESGKVRDQFGQTGEFVQIEPGDTKRVELSWRVNEEAATGAYDVIAAVWYGYPGDGAERIGSTSWQENQFEVLKNVNTERVTYQGADYTVEYRNDGTVAVFDSNRNLVDAGTAKQVLEYIAFRRYSSPDPTRGWWKTVEQGDDLKGHYIASHLTQGGITVYKAYIKIKAGSKSDATGEAIDLADQAATVYNEQAGNAHSQRVKSISDTSATAYTLYSGSEDVKRYGEFIVDAYELKQSSESADTMLDAVQAAETTDGKLDPDLRQLAISGALAPLNDASAGLQVTQKQSLVVYQWSEMQKPLLGELSQLAAKREAGTITRDEMRSYFVLQMSFHGSGAQMSDTVAYYQRKGRQKSVAFKAISQLQHGGDLAEEMENSGDGFRNLKNIKMEHMAEFEIYADELIDSSVNVRGDPNTDPVLRPEPISITGPGWVEPGEPIRLHVESRGKPVVNAEVSIGEKIIETDRNGNATVTLYEKDVYSASVTKTDFESAQTSVQVREPNVVSRTLDDIDYDELSTTPVSKQTELENTGETTLKVSSVTSSHDGVTTKINSQEIEPGEKLVVEVTIDPDQFDDGPFVEPVTVEWDTPGGKTVFLVRGLIDRSGVPDPVLSAPSKVPAGSTVTLDASESIDPDGDDSQLNYNWAIVDVPSGDSVTLPTDETGEVTLSTVGTYEFEVTVRDAQNSADTATVVIEATEQAEAVCDGCKTPNDLDGDGKYEDINGNEVQGFGDVITLFENLQSDAVTENTELYDYNDNGVVGFGDVIYLFESI